MFLDPASIALACREPASAARARSAVLWLGSMRRRKRPNERQGSKVGPVLGPGPASLIETSQHAPAGVRDRPSAVARIGFVKRWQGRTSSPQASHTRSATGAGPPFRESSVDVSVGLSFQSDRALGFVGCGRRERRGLGGKSIRAHQCGRNEVAGRGSTRLWATIWSAALLLAAASPLHPERLQALLAGCRLPACSRQAPPDILA